MTRSGGCRCGTVRFRVEGPVRDVIVCHCDACRDAGGEPWRASAARRTDLTIENEDWLAWQRAAVSAFGASRAFCKACGDYLFWDAPGRDAVSLSAEALDDRGADLAVIAHIWVEGEEARAAIAATDVPAAESGLPPDVPVTWAG